MIVDYGTRNKQKEARRQAGKGACTSYGPNVSVHINFNLVVNFLEFSYFIVYTWFLSSFSDKRP